MKIDPEKLAALCRLDDAGMCGDLQPLQQHDVWDRLEELGEALHAGGGSAAMLAAAHAAMAHYPDAFNALNRRWHGIGEWCRPLGIPWQEVVYAFERSSDGYGYAWNGGWAAHFEELGQRLVANGAPDGAWVAE